MINKKVPLIFSHLTASLIGLIATAVYHHWWINPQQVRWLQTIVAMNQTTVDIGYPGDWVLDILFPAVPLLGFCLIGLTVSLLVLKRR